MALPYTQLHAEVEPNFWKDYLLSDIENRRRQMLEDYHQTRMNMEKERRNRDAAASARLAASAIGIGKQLWPTSSSEQLAALSKDNAQLKASENALPTRSAIRQAKAAELPQAEQQRAAAVQADRINQLYDASKGHATLTPMQVWQWWFDNGKIGYNDYQNLISRYGGTK